MKIKNNEKSLSLLKTAVSIILIIIMAVIIIFLVKGLIPVIKEIIDTKDFNLLKEYFRSFGTSGFFASVSIQALQLLVPIFPAAPLRMMSGLSYGLFLGSAICILGGAIGSSIIYFLVSFFDGKFISIFTKKDSKIMQLKNGSLRKNTIVSLALLVIPIFPCGIGCYYAANSKMKPLRYMIVTTLGMVPSIILTVLVGEFSFHFNFTWAIIILSVIVAVTIVTLIFKNKFMEYMSRYIKSGKDKEIKSPNKFLYTLGVNILNIYLKFKVNLKIYNDQMDEIDSPFLLISNHPSSYDFIYTAIALSPHKLNVVASRYLFKNPFRAKVFDSLGAISKDPFESDIMSIKQILKTAKSGKNVALFPEGRLSASGKTQQVSPAIVKLVRHVKMPIIISKIQGNYLTFNRWDGKCKKGRVEVTVKPLLTVHEIITLSDDEIYSRIMQELDYNDFEWQKKKRIAYKNVSAEGLENILYVCPKCKKEFTMITDKERIVCADCINTISLNEYYDLIPENENSVVPETIADWYDLQIQHEIDKMEHYDCDLQERVKLSIIRKDSRKFQGAGEGFFEIYESGARYTGTFFGEKTQINFPVSSLTSIPYEKGKYFEIYYQYECYRFMPEKAVKAVQWSIVMEQALKLSQKSLAKIN